MSAGTGNRIYAGIEQRQIGSLLVRDASEAFERIEDPQLAVDTAVAVVRTMLSHVPREQRLGAGCELVSKALL